MELDIRLKVHTDQALSTSMMFLKFTARLKNILLIITSTTAAYGKLLYWLLYI